MNDARRRKSVEQELAADPDVNVVLEAAAGSGKTTVLVDRYLRLCLGGAGVDPQAVLAITFTRKATIEIKQRIQQRVLALARLAGDDLAAALRDLLGHDPTRAESVRAAWFHDVLLADPAGRGIDTMHAFCQRVLGRFAAEAGLDPAFTVLDERQEEERRDEALDQLEATLAREPDALREYAALAGSYGGARKAVATLFAHRVHLQRWIDRVAPPPTSAPAALGRALLPCLPALRADLRAGLLADTVWHNDADVDPATLAPALAHALRRLAGPGLAAVRDHAGGKQTDKFREGLDQLGTSARTLADVCDAEPARCLEQVVPQAASLLLTAGGSVRKKLATNSPVPAGYQPVYQVALLPVLALIQQARLAMLFAHNVRLLRVMLQALDRYAAVKRRDRVVDFQDLEYLALRLLTDPHTGPQVHFRLDARLDHLLLDEFQDTNRNQWDLLRPLLEEILAGGDDPPRTAFIVGDVKQSIYSFRGAEPSVFGRAREWFRMLPQARVLELPTNFRSVPAVVDAVGTLCNREPLATILGDEAASARQEAARQDDGRVVFLAPFAPGDAASGHERAAAATVTLVQRLLAGPGLRRDDILVLCRTKTHVAVYESALRRAGLAFTPAGRGLLARSREVQDVLALLRWLTYPADDVAGATVLRSPIVRALEATVQALLQARLGAGRRRTLREVLTSEAAAHGLADAQARLEGWFEPAGRLTPHDLLRLVFRDGELLERFEIAGGEQARFNLLRLTDLALGSERRGGSLRAFVDELDLAALVGGEEEGTLPGEDGSGRVRVMTIHAAKGLEARVVILVDAAADRNDKVALLDLGAAGADGPWVTGLSSDEIAGIALPDATTLPPPLAPRLADAIGRQRREDAHVLYVAMTRACDQLFVLGGESQRGGDSSYLEWLHEADTDGAYWRDDENLAADDDAEATPTAGVATSAARARLRPWTPPSLSPRLRVENPSRLAHADPTAGAPDAREERDPDDAAAPPAAADAATRRGTAIHLWLERAARAGAMPPGAGEPWEVAAAVVRNPELRWIFAPGSGVRGFCEQPMLHHVSTEGHTEVRRYGSIDRLLVRPEGIDVIDYKSDRVDSPAEVDERVAGYGPQLAAYRDALAAVYPDRPIRCWLLFTHVTTPAGRGMLREVIQEDRR